MLLVALGFAGWRAATERFRRQRVAMEFIEELGGTYAAQPGGAAWLRDALGEDQFQEVVAADVSGAPCGETCLRHLLALPRLQKLAVGGPEVDDRALQRLRTLTELRLLLLDSSSVSEDGIRRFRAARPQVTVLRSQRRAIAALRDAGATVVVLHQQFPPEVPANWSDEHFQSGTIVFYRDQAQADVLAQLEHLTDLQTLRLDRSGVTDAQLAHIESLTKLVWLDLAGTQVGDAGIRRLAGLSRLRWLALEGTDVSAACANELRRALPGAVVRR